MASGLSVFFLFIQEHFTFNVRTSLQYRRIYLQPRLTYKIHTRVPGIVHPRELRTCTEPSQASARCGEAPLV